MKLWFASAVAILLLAAGCAPAAPVQQSSGGQVPAQEKPATNQILRVAQASIPTTLSPEQGETHRPVFWTMYDMLVYLDRNQTPIPSAAERWEQTTPTTFRFTLRKDLTFSNGDKLTAADVEYTIKYMVSTKTPPIGRFKSLTDARAIDDYTVEVINKAPDASTLTNLAFLVILPSKYHQSVGKDGFIAKPIGSGPYELAEFQNNTKIRLTLRKTPHPFRKPVATEIDFLNISEQSAIVAGLKTGDIDLVLTVPFIGERLDDLEKSGMTLMKIYSSVAEVVLPQGAYQRKNTPLQDKRVRQALNYAVDKDAISRKFYRGDVQPTANSVPPSSQFFNPEIPAYPYDPAKAKALLAEAGYPNGFKLDSLDYYGTADLVQVVQGYLRDVGVDLTLKSVDYGLYTDEFIGKAPKGDLFNITMVDPDGFNGAVRIYFGCDLVPADPMYCNKQFDSLNDQAAAEPDRSKRVALFQQAAKILADDAHAIYLFQNPSWMVVSPKIRGIKYENTAFVMLENAYRIE